MSNLEGTVNRYLSGLEAGERQAEAQSEALRFQEVNNPDGYDPGIHWQFTTPDGRNVILWPADFDRDIDAARLDAAGQLGLYGKWPWV